MKRCTRALAFLLILLLVMPALGERERVPVWLYPSVEDLPTLADGAILRVAFLPLEISDSILLQTAECTVLVDTGTRASAGVLLDALFALGVDAIDTVLFTHPHDDHVGGFIEIAGALPIGRLVTSSQKTETPIHNRAWNAAIAADIPIETWTEDIDLGLDPVMVDMFRLKSGALNNQSIVLRLAVGESALLLPGDLESAGQRNLIAKRPEMIQGITLLKAPHHGLSTMYGDFWTGVDPGMIVITNGNNSITGRYRNDAKRILPLCTLLYTMEGMVEFTTDGTAWRGAQWPR